MGIVELIVLAAARQLNAGLKNIADVGAATAANPIAKEAWKETSAVCANAEKALLAGMKAADQEFSAKQAYEQIVLDDEKKIAALLAGLPLPAP